MRHELKDKNEERVQRTKFVDKLEDENAQQLEKLMQQKKEFERLEKEFNKVHSRVQGLDRMDKKKQDKIQRIMKEKEEFESKQKRRLMAKNDDWKVNQEKEKQLRIARSMGTLRNEKCVQWRETHKQVMEQHKFNKEKNFFMAQQDTAIVEELVRQRKEEMIKANRERMLQIRNHLTLSEIQHEKQHQLKAEKTRQRILEEAKELEEKTRKYREMLLDAEKKEQYMVQQLKQTDSQKVQAEKILKQTIDQSKKQKTLTPQMEEELRAAKEMRDYEMGLLSVDRRNEIDRMKFKQQEEERKKQQEERQAQRHENMVHREAEKRKRREEKLRRKFVEEQKLFQKDSLKRQQRAEEILEWKKRNEAKQREINEKQKEAASIDARKKVLEKYN